MARDLRYVPPGSLVEVTCRTIQGRFLLRPSRELNEIVYGILGRAAEKRGAAGADLHAPAPQRRVRHRRLVRPFRRVRAPAATPAQRREPEDREVRARKDGRARARTACSPFLLPKAGPLRRRISIQAGTSRPEPASSRSRPPAGPSKRRESRPRVALLRYTRHIPRSGTYPGPYLDWR